VKIYGPEPGWRVEGYSRDINGAVTLEVVKPWSPLLEDDGDALRLPDIPVPPVIQARLLHFRGIEKQLIKH